MNPDPRTRLARIGSAVRRAGLVAGPLAMTAFVLLAGQGIGTDARVVLGMALWMALWWMSEAVPLAVTSLLPLVILPLFTSLGFAAASAPYASNVVYLFMGGFMLGLAMQRWGLHRRIALAMLVAMGSGQRQLIAGFMLATALLSMWLSNTATMMMLAPIGLSVVQTWREERAPANATDGFAAALMLGIAYAASIGGMATPIGTPPNLVMAGFMRAHYSMDITMLQWLRVGLPVVLILLPLTWLWLCFGAFRLGNGQFAGGRQALRIRLRDLGPAGSAEWRVGAVFALVAGGWVLRPQLALWLNLPGLDDALIALLGAMALFILPAGDADGTRLLDWNTARGLPWDILLLFGGGLSLAAAITSSGADVPIAALIGKLGELGPGSVMVLLAAVLVFSGELTSNTAAASAIMPILAVVCTASGLEPLPVFMVATLSASCGFMLPVATPPNAIAYGSGCVPLGAMIRAGFGLNLLGILVVVGYVWFIAF
ncbi:MAG: SLC13/DASS family transporter [Gammaproteobacteria bacterium]|nr:SLC13/DASS family transporter [Gammaproteobacteria bacterium]